MTEEVRQFLFLLLGNCLVVILYLAFCLLCKKGSAKSCLLRAAVMLLCPVAGPLFFAVGFVLNRLFFRKEVDLADVIFSKTRVKTYLRADEELERNLVPLEEAIAVTDTANLRTLMMNVVRGDIQKSLSSISLALNSEDSETSHYAASVLQDALNDFRANVQKNYQQMKKEENDPVSYGPMLIDYMNQVLEQRVFTDMEQKTFVLIMDDVSEMLYQKDPERMTSAYFEAVSMRLLEVRQFELCKKWCERAMLQYPNTLASYTCQLKFYFTAEEKEEFFRVLSALRASAIVIDNETLELIRVFL
ncbi:MAG: hypothetical protein IJ468_13300 [Lachnospiraceae bacterium]|nr:hypothetical protein [Lachnospiraceae bacterium]